MSVQAALTCLGRVRCRGMGGRGMGRGRHGGTHCEQLPSDRVFRRQEVRVRKMKDQKAEICSNKKRKVEGDHKAREKKRRLA